MELFELDLRQLARRVRARELGAVEVARAYLERIARLEPTINAYITVDERGALAGAEETDRRLAAGEDVGPLAGVPLALKDNLVSGGLATSCGSRVLAGWRPPYDGTVVARLRRAGATVLGKTNMDEFAMGSSTESSAAGPCRNPWRRDRVPGGSSGGSAAAVAARLCAAAIGTDTGGSIRQPAAFCGVVGLKPTYGRVSRYGVIAFASSLDQVGPIARTAEDAAALLAVIGGHDPLDATSLASPLGDYRGACGRDVAGLRLGVPREYFGEGLDAAVERAVRAAIEQLRQLGAEIVDVSLPHTRYAIATYYLICMAEASSNLARYDGVRFGQRAADPGDVDELYRATRQQGFGAEVQRRVMLGTFALSAGYYDAYYGKAQRVRTLIRDDFARAFERCDALVAPTTPTAAFALGEKLDDPLQMYLADIYTIGASLAGLPGASVPCGATGEGLPVGLQILAPPLAEETVLTVAAAHGRAAPGRRWGDELPEAGR